MTSLRPLVVIGAATALLDVIDLVTAINAQVQRFTIVGALDDNTALHGTEIGGVRILGSLPMARNLNDVDFVFAICSYKFRIKRIDILRSLGVERDRFVTLVHPHAEVSRTAIMGRGCTIYSNACISSGARLGDFTVLVNSAFVSPYCVFEDFAMAAGLAFIGTNAKLGIGAFMAGSSSVAPGVTVGPGGMVGLASAAFRDVPAGATVVGNPARMLEIMAVPPHLETA